MKKLIKKHTKKELYKIATDILYYLEGKNFCIWQAYAKDDIELGLGRAPTLEEMSAMQERLANIWEQIC